MTVAFAVAAGLSVGNVYAVQPLLDAIGQSLGMKLAWLGLAVTLTQLGYATGLVLLVPISDIVDRRRLILVQSGLSVLALLAVASASSSAILLVALSTVGLLAVTVQTLVAYAAALTAPHERGTAVGKVTSGVVIGILGARLCAGMINDLLGWRAVYVVSALALTIMALVLRSTLPADDRPKRDGRYLEMFRSLPGLFLRDRLLLLRGLFAFVIFAAFSTFWTPLVLPLTQPPYSLSHMQIGLFGIAGIAGALGARGAGGLADRGFADRMTGSALLLLSLSWALIAMMPLSLWLLAVGMVALDLAVQAVHVTNQALIVARHTEAQGRVIAGYMVFYSLGSAFGAAASTYTYSRLGWNGVCTLGGSISVAGLFLFLITSRRNHRFTMGP